MLGPARLARREAQLGNSQPIYVFQDAETAHEHDVRKQEAGRERGPKESHAYSSHTHANVVGWARCLQLAALHCVDENNLTFNLDRRIVTFTADGVFPNGAKRAAAPRG